MPRLIVIGFDDTEQAHRAQARMAALEKRYLNHPEDAAVAIRDTRRVRCGSDRASRRPESRSASGLLTSGFFSSLIGLLFLNPLAGLARRGWWAPARARSPAA